MLKSDWNISCRTTVRSLTLKELVNPSHIKQRDGFNTHISDHLGASSTKMDFEPSDITPDCVYYEDTDSPIQEGSPDKVFINLGVGKILSGEPSWIGESVSS